MAILNSVLEDKKLTALEKYVLILISRKERLIDENKKVKPIKGCAITPYKETLCDLFDKEPRAIKRILVSLHNKGFIELDWNYSKELVKIAFIKELRSFSGKGHFTQLNNRLVTIKEPQLFLLCIAIRRYMYRKLSDGFTEVSYKKIGSIIGTSYDTSISNYIKEAEQKGYIQVIKGEQGLPNRYRLDNFYVCKPTKDTDYEDYEVDEDYEEDVEYDEYYNEIDVINLRNNNNRGSKSKKNKLLPTYNIVHTEAVDFNSYEYEQDSINPRFYHSKRS
jgi:hypothetical protein